MSFRGLIPAAVLAALFCPRASMADLDSYVQKPDPSFSWKVESNADTSSGKVFTFDITQTFAASALAASMVPIMMIVLSTTLPPRANRTTNLVVAALLIPWMAFNLTGGEWLAYYGLGFALELTLLAFIIRSAWTWHRTPTIPSLMQ